MYNVRKTFAAVATSIAFISGSIALADGLASKDKVRTPLAAGAFTMIGAHSKPARSSIVTKKQREQLKITVWLRKNLRSQTRTMNAVAREDQPAIPFHLTKDAVNPERSIDRLRLVKRGMGALPMRCQTLHTHERAICQRDVQLRKSQQSVKLAFSK